MTEIDSFVATVVNRADPRHSDAILWIVWSTIQANEGVTLHRLMRNLCEYQLIEPAVVHSALFSLTNPNLYNSVIRAHKPSVEGKPTFLSVRRRANPAWAEFLARVETYPDFKLYKPAVF